MKVFIFFLCLLGSSLSYPQYQGPVDDTKGVPAQQTKGDLPPHDASTCQSGSSCVSWKRCYNGFIEPEGAPLSFEKPTNFEELKCGEELMCCGLPGDILGLLQPQIQDKPVESPQQEERAYPPPVSSCGHSSYDCVPYFQCIDGVINTDGAGLLDVRIRPQATCVNPEYPDVPALCCLIPGAVPTPEPIETCPGYKECVDFNLCSADGTINTDGSGLIDIRTGYTSCYLPSGLGGICCTPPPPYIDECPSNSVCLPGSACLGQALDASSNFIGYSNSGLWTHCGVGGGNDVCCIPPVLDNCPGEAVCVQASECKGQALNALNEFVDYTPTGPWTHCSGYDQGICCIPPEPIYKPSDKCGVRNYKLDQRITSNYEPNEAHFGEFPWQAIIFYQNYTFVCGATLISHKHVLTAAHCVKDLLAGDIRIRFGEWQVNSFEEAFPYVDKNVFAISIHSNFNPVNLKNDFAVLELVEPLELQYHINTICIPSYGQVFPPGTRCFTTGWGKDSFTGNFQHILKKVEVPYVDKPTCQSLLRKTRLGKYFQLDSSFMCAGGEANKDACYGDGGGPLVCKDSLTGQYVQVGITAWGIGCGTQDVPGVYADVQEVSNWINDIVIGVGGAPGSVPGYGK